MKKLLNYLDSYDFTKHLVYLHLVTLLFVASTYLTLR